MSPSADCYVWLRWVGIAALCITVLVPAPAARAACVGDCNHDGEVTVEEVLLGVNLALGTEPSSTCPDFDGNADGAVSINDLLAAVNAALHGCPVTPTPTATATATPGTPKINHAPVLQCAEIYRTYPALPIQLPIAASDEDGDHLHFTASDLPVGAHLDATTGILTWTPDGQQVGVFYVPFTATDDGVPPLSADGLLTIKVSPSDLCVPQTACDQASGCENLLLPLTQPCCIDVPTVRVPEPVTGCPQGRGLFVGRNTDGGVGRLSDCDPFRVVNSGQTSATVRFNVEAGCINSAQPVMLHARLETNQRLVLDTTAMVVLELGDDGLAQRLAVSLPVQAGGPFFDFDGVDAALNVTLTDADGVSVSQQLRVTLTFKVLSDITDPIAPTPPIVSGMCQQ